MLLVDVRRHTSSTHQPMLAQVAVVNTSVKYKGENEFDIIIDGERVAKVFHKRSDGETVLLAKVFQELASYDIEFS